MNVAHLMYVKVMSRGLDSPEFDPGRAEMFSSLKPALRRTPSSYAMATAGFFRNPCVKLTILLNLSLRCRSGMDNCLFNLHTP
jgi:hypothetical protein